MIHSATARSLLSANTGRARQATRMRLRSIDGMASGLALRYIDSTRRFGKLARDHQRGNHVFKTKLRVAEVFEYLADHRGVGVAFGTARGVAEVLLHDAFLTLR